MLSRLDWWLWIAFLVISVACVFIVALYYFTTRKRALPYFDNPRLRLHYFLQKQVNATGQVVGYECLLRQQLPDSSWNLPKNVDLMPLHRVITLLDDTLSHLPPARINLSINLSQEQIASREFTYFVRWAVSKINPITLVIEYRSGKVLHGWKAYKFRRHLKAARAAGMRFAIDNVDAELSTLHRIEWLLSEVDILKCSMNSFRKEDPSVWLDLNLQFWNKLAKERHIDLYLVGIESPEDEALASQFKIRFRQGYLFGKPMPHISEADRATLSQRSNNDNSINSSGDIPPISSTPENRVITDSESNEKKNCAVSTPSPHSLHGDTQ